VVSLYPFVQKSRQFPIGTPYIIVDDFDQNPTEAYFGIMHVTMLPPRNLLYPVLPYPTKNKLYFPLCRSCVDENCCTPCPHRKRSQRSLTHTWCTPELQLAVKKGYRILQVHEVWHFPQR